MNDDELDKLVKKDLQLKAQILISDMDLEMTLGITQENREEYYQRMLDQWEDPSFLRTATKEILEQCYDHVNESLMLLNQAREQAIDTSDIACLDEKYREQWIRIQENFGELLQ
jgi:hypothetical protein